MAARAGAVAHHHGVRWLAAVALVACSHAPATVASQPRRDAVPGPVTVRRGGLVYVDHFAPGPRADRGAVHGKITDTAGEPAIGATVVLTTPAIRGEQVVISDEHGVYRFDTVVPGTYRVTYYYMNGEFVHDDLPVHAGIVTRERVRDMPADEPRRERGIVCRAAGAC